MKALRPRPIIDSVRDSIWGPRLAELPSWRARVLGLVRLVVTLARDLWSGEFNLRAMSLAYVTLVSVVPMLALSFSVLKGFGVHQQIEPMLNKFLAPLGADGVEVARRIVEFIGATEAGMLGTVGFAFLLYTAVALVQQIEASFNAIWRIRRARGLGEQFVRYLSVVLVGPFLLFLALGIAAAVMNQNLVQQLLLAGPFREVEAWVSRLAPVAVVIVALTFIYAFIPNARVRFGAAFLGGVIAGVLWGLTGVVFSIFVQVSTAYAAIYSGFAVLILFMLWVYLSWFIVLLGASIAFYTQHPGHVSSRRATWGLSSRMSERLAIVVTGMIAQHHVSGRRPWSLAALSQALETPAQAIEEVLRSLERAGLLAQTNDNPPAYLPARDIGSTPVALVIEAVRQRGEGRYWNPKILPATEAGERIVTAMDEAINRSLDGLTIADLLDADPPQSNEEQSTGV